jgi:predicted nucleotidyltransferase
MTGLTERDRLVIERFKQLMLEHGVPLHSTVLFGSRARGDYEPDSDHDVLVIVAKLDHTIRQTISDCAWEAGFEDCLVITPVVVTRDEIEYSPFRSSLLMQAVQEDGIPI